MRSFHTNLIIHLIIYNLFTKINVINYEFDLGTFFKNKVDVLIYRINYRKLIYRIWITYTPRKLTKAESQLNIITSFLLLNSYNKFGYIIIQNIIISNIY